MLALFCELRNSTQLFDPQNNAEILGSAPFSCVTAQLISSLLTCIWFYLPYRKKSIWEHIIIIMAMEKYVNLLLSSLVCYNEAVTVLIMDWTLGR